MGRIALSFTIALALTLSWCAGGLPGGHKAAFASPAVAEIDKWSLWTGETQLRGANIWQRRVYPELNGFYFLGPGPVGPPYTQQDFNDLAAMGANYVNISHPGLFTETSPYTLDTDIQDNLDDLIAKIAAANMFAVISFRTGPGRSEFTFVWDEVGDWFGPGYLDDSMWQDQAAQDAWAQMWRYTAQRYMANPVVAGYDLMVEPNSNEVGSHALFDYLDIWDPAEFYWSYGGTLYDWNQLYPDITTAIREVDATTPILIGAMAYSAVEWLPYLEPTTDLRTVYMVHQYEPVKYTHQGWWNPDCTYPGLCDVDWDGIPELFNRAWLEDLHGPIDLFKAVHGVPVAANEFGPIRWEPGADLYMDDQMDLFEQRGMNHALWMWYPQWEPYATEVHDFNFRFGPDPRSRTDVESSDLMDVILEYWGRNTVRPYGEYTLEVQASHGAGSLNLDFMVGTPAPATWANYLILTVPTVQVVPLWTVQLPAIDPPIDVPVSFSFPGTGWIGIYTGLFTAGGQQAVDLTWVDTD